VDGEIDEAAWSVLRADRRLLTIPAMDIAIIDVPAHFHAAELQLWRQSTSRA